MVIQGQGPKVSVIMLTYNREKYLPAAIGAVLGQSFRNFEFIIINNGSDDGSSDIIKHYMEQDGRIKDVELCKSTIAVGRQAGVDRAKGMYIAFIDDDDYISEDYLQYLINLAESKAADIAYCGSYKAECTEKKDNCVPIRDEVLTGAEAVVKLLQRKECNAALPSKLICRELFDEISFLPESVHEDIFVTYKLFASAQSVAVGTEKKYCFVRHGNNISSFTDSDKLLSPGQLEEYFSAFKERTEYLSAKLPQIADYAQYSEWSYMISMCNKIERNQLQSCSEQLAHVREVLLEHYDEFYDGKYIEGFEKEWMVQYIMPHLPQ